jgi:hypothetical protein
LKVYPSIRLIPHFLRPLSFNPRPRESHVSIPNLGYQKQQGKKRTVCLFCPKRTGHGYWFFTFSYFKPHHRWLNSCHHFSSQTMQCFGSPSRSSSSYNSGSQKLPALGQNFPANSGKSLGSGKYKYGCSQTEYYIYFKEVLRREIQGLKV